MEAWAIYIINEDAKVISIRRLTMKSNFDKAVRKAFEEIKYLTDRGVMKYMESFSRPASIGC